MSDLTQARAALVLALAASETLDQAPDNEYLFSSFPGDDFNEAYHHIQDALRQIRHDLANLEQVAELAFKQPLH